MIPPGVPGVTAARGPYSGGAAMPFDLKNSGVAPVGATPSALIAITLPLRGSKMRAWVSPPQLSVSHIVEVAAIIAQAASTALPPFAKIIAPAVAASGLPVMAIQCLPWSTGLAVRPGRRRVGGGEDHGEPRRRREGSSSWADGTAARRMRADAYNRPLKYASGFHAVERHEAQPFRWMAAEGVVELDQPARFLELEIRGVADETAQQVSIDAGGGPQRMRAGRRLEHDFHAPSPRAAARCA